MTKLTVINEAFYKPIKPNFIKVSDEKKFKTEINFAIQILKNNSYLQTCDSGSILESVLNVSQTGLSLNPVTAYAYLVPMKGKCVLMPGYQGLIKLVTDAGSVKSIEVQLIFEGDDIVVDLASDQKVKKHIPYLLTGKDKGEIIGGYSVGTLADGSRHIEIMSRKDIEEIRDCSESYKNAIKKGWKNSPWQTNESEMFRKTIVRRHFKYLPKTDNKQLEKALELDNQDYDFPISLGQGNYIESLLITASIDEKTSTNIYNTLSDMTQSRAEECIIYLKDNQKDPIESGSGYSHGDIQKKLSELK
jgi:phage RecT family recombinase